MRYILKYSFMLWFLLGTTCLIQAQDTLLPYPTDTIDGKIYYQYTVERRIGLYRISVNFGVKQEEILKANPQLQKKGLRYGEVILIPAKQSVVAPKNTIIAQQEPEEIDAPASIAPAEQFDDVDMALSDTISVEWDTTMLDTIDVAENHTDTMHIIDSTATRLTFLLPLHTDAIKRDKNMERFYDFYAGALIAIYQAQAKGQMLEVFTYDVDKSANQLKQVWQQHPEIRQTDVIIGPAYGGQVAAVMDSITNDSIWLLIPFLSRVEGIEKSPHMLKFNPSERIEADTIARYLAQRKDSINCILIEAKEGEVIPSGISALHRAIKQYQVPASTIALRAILSDSIEGAFRSDKENIVIFNTERFGNLQTVMPHLLKACGNYKITLFSHYSWQNEKIILPQLYTSVFAPTPTVPESYTQLFEQYFDHELSSTQPRYDLLGYDITSQLLDMLQHSNDTTHLISDQIWEGIQAHIHYQATAPDGGYENHIVHIIHQ